MRPLVFYRSPSKKHAVMVNIEGGKVEIEIRKLEKEYELSVIDSGPGDSNVSVSDKPGTKTGLKNTRRRLFSIYGDNAYFEANFGNHGSKVCFRISGRQSIYMEHKWDDTA